MGYKPIYLIDLIAKGSRALARTPTHPGAMAPRSATSARGLGNKVNKVNRIVNIYYIMIYIGPLLPPHPPYCQPLGRRAPLALPGVIGGPGTWFLPADPCMARPKGTAAKHKSVVSSPVRLRP